MEYFLGNFKSNVSWEEIWKEAKEETKKNAASSKCLDAVSGSTYQCRQTPVSPIDTGN
jgi:hypothetical protein